ncbi:MAG: 50S ribosomal protein L22 [Cyanobacteria bacterium]|nr:50S ribosomal protein L22 [Cyanobacteriota bacterium]MDA1020957.1 50S ribosomal protein L22 [Cyanobacteriota bacterium]
MAKKDQEQNTKHPAKQSFASDVDTQEVGTVQSTGSAKEDKKDSSKMSNVVEETAEKKPAKKASAKKTKEVEKKPAKATNAKTETKVVEASSTETKPETKLVRARIGFMRQTARKVRRCVNLIRTMTAGDAVTQLGFAPYAAALPIKKLIESAMANASHNFAIQNPENLKISQLLVDDGVVYKRWRAVSKGTAHSIKKRTAQVRLVLSEMNAAEYAAYVWDNSPRNKKKGKVA